MRTLLFIFLIPLLDMLTMRGLRFTFPQWFVRRAKSIRTALTVQAAVTITILLGGLLLQRRVSDYRLITGYYVLFGLAVALYGGKAVYGLAVLADGVRHAVGRRLSGRTGARKAAARSMPVSAGFWTGVAVGALVLWGICFGRFRFTVEQVEVAIDHLPPSFDGYRIVQISDVHAGSFAGFTGRLKKAADLINQQDAHLVVFTGDMVNNFGAETEPLVPIFSQLTARHGKYAVLGNHDYGGYTRWKSPADSVANHVLLEKNIERMGFVLLKNRSVVIDGEHGDRLALVGIENWGHSRRHPRKGNLAKATLPVEEIPVKILLSHDPYFWQGGISKQSDISLTLSGHTHGMQMGIKWGGKHYSPASLAGYHLATGLFQKGQTSLYINRGLGVIAYPGRIGMPPEITVLTLRRKQSPAP